MSALRERDFWRRYHAQGAAPGLEREVRVTLPWSAAMDVALLAGPATKVLLLIDRTTGTQHRLGWWDEARWHPFALRWRELEALAGSWGARADLEPRPPVPLLLLSCFVGVARGDGHERRHAEGAVAAGFRELGFDREEAGVLARRALPEVDDAGYRWQRDPELGWVFGGEYPCYSIRNRAHLYGGEGLFPFAEVRARFGP